MITNPSPAVSDTELSRVQRPNGELVLLLSQRRLDRGGVRAWLTLRFDRPDGSRPRHFTLGLDELSAIESAIAEVRRAAKGDRP